MAMTVELVGYDRPSRLASRTTASWATITGAVTFEAAGSGTRMRWDWELRPKGAAKLATPILGIVGRRQERACWTGLKRCLETGAGRSLRPATR